MNFAWRVGRTIVRKVLTVRNRDVWRGVALEIITIDF